MTRSRARLARLERDQGVITATEVWHETDDRDVFSGPNGEVLTRAELDQRPVPPNTQRICVIYVEMGKPFTRRDSEP